MKKPSKKPSNEQRWEGDAKLPKPRNAPSKDDMEDDVDADENMD